MRRTCSFRCHYRTFFSFCSSSTRLDPFSSIVLIFVHKFESKKEKEYIIMMRQSINKSYIRPFFSFTEKYNVILLYFFDFVVVVVVCVLKIPLGCKMSKSVFHTSTLWVSNVHDKSDERRLQRYHARTEWWRKIPCQTNGFHRYATSILPQL